MEFMSYSLEETKKIAFDFAEQIYKGAPFANPIIIGLYGELGTGKTTFMKYFAEALGVKETIQSPTFVIMKSYNTSPHLPLGRSPLSLTRRGEEENGSFLGGEVFEKLIHIDAYRIEKTAEMLNLGWEELISSPKNIICIEWPEKIRGIMPPHIVVRFEHNERENERKISIT